ncbi:MAG: PilX N-terminal domain-containing pilus assembly protein [Pseudohongiellaceae bacterium]
MNRDIVRHSAAPQRQSGVALILSMIFLLVVTLLATGSMESSILEERMAGNLRSHNLAFQAAESSLKSGEGWLQSQVLLPGTSSDGSTVVWSSNAPDPDSDGDEWWEERDGVWWNSNAEQLGGLSGVQNQPQYVIEEHFTGFQGQSLTIGTGEVSTSRVMHRITARGVGGDSNAEVLLQSTHLRPYD